MNFTTSYSMEYFTHNGGGVPKVRFTLRMKDYDISSWTTTQGTYGIWLGIGFGSQIMDGADIVHCQYAFSNNSNVDKFVCNDRYSSIHSLPPLDKQRDTEDVNTVALIKRQDNGKFLATLEATFDRPCNTGDSEDEPLIMGSMNELIWAFGPLSSGNSMVHGTTSKDRGGLNNFFVIQLSSSVYALLHYSWCIVIGSLLLFSAF